MQHALVTWVQDILKSRQITGEELVVGLLQSLADEHSEAAYCAIALDRQPPQTMMSDLEELLRLRSVRSGEEALDFAGDSTRVERRQRLSTAQLAGHLLVKELRLLSEKNAETTFRRATDQECLAGANAP